MKKVSIMVALVALVGVALPSFAVETLPTARQVWSDGGWRNWAEIVTKADAGQLDAGVDGWVVDIARYNTGEIDAAELWSRAEAALPQEQYSIRFAEIGFRILLKDPSSATAAKIRAEFDAAISGDDANAAKAANGAYARFHYKNDDATAWIYFVKCADYPDSAVQVGLRLLKDGTANAETVYRGAVAFFDNGIPAAAARPMLTLLLKAAIAADIAPTEVRTTLERIRRLYSGRAVGESDEAKTWGIFVGSLNESIKAW